MGKNSEFSNTSKPTWFAVTDRKAELLLVSAITSWVSHWDIETRRSRRCGGDRCELCRFGAPKVQRWVAIGVDKRGSDRLVEFRERHRGFFERCRVENGTAAGARIAIWKSGAAKNAPVEVALVGFEKVWPRDISNFVDCLGLPARLVGGEVISDQLQGIEALFEGLSSARSMNVEETT